MGGRQAGVCICMATCSMLNTAYYIRLRIGRGGARHRPRACEPDRRVRRRHRRRGGSFGGGRPGNKAKLRVGVRKLINEMHKITKSAKTMFIYSTHTRNTTQRSGNRKHIRLNCSIYTYQIPVFTCILINM